MSEKVKAMLDAIAEWEFVGHAPRTTERVRSHAEISSTPCLRGGGHG